MNWQIKVEMKYCWSNIKKIAITKIIVVSNSISDTKIILDILKLKNVTFTCASWQIWFSNLAIQNELVLKVKRSIRVHFISLITWFILWYLKDINVFWTTRPYHPENWILHISALSDIHKVITEIRPLIYYLHKNNI